MKKFKKLIPALCMLLVSAVLVGTSTYAWFSMNDNVTVTGLQVTAQTDQPYLIIGTGENDTAEELQALPKKEPVEGKTVNFDVSDTDAKVKPVAHETLANAAAAETAGNWYWYNAEKTSASGQGANTKNTLTDVAGYVITRTVYMTIVKDTPQLSDIKATVAITAKDGKTIDAAKVLLAVYNDTADKGTEEFDKAKTASTSLKTGVVTDATVVKVVIYIYIDGADASIYTDNAANLGTAKIDITFKAIV